MIEAVTSALAESSSSNFVVAPSVGLVVWTLLWLGSVIALAMIGRARYGQSALALLVVGLVLSPLAPALWLMWVARPRAPRLGR